MGREILFLILMVIFVQIASCASPPNHHDNHRQEKENAKTENKRPRVRHRHRTDGDGSNSNKHQVERTNPLGWNPASIGHWEWVPNTRSGKPWNAYTMAPLPTTMQMPPMYPFFPMPMVPAFMPAPIQLPPIENAHAVGPVPSNHQKHRTQVPHTDAKNDEPENLERTHATIDRKATEGSTNRNSKGNRHKGEIESPKHTHSTNDQKTNEDKNDEVPPGERSPDRPKRTKSRLASKNDRLKKTNKRTDSKIDPRRLKGEMKNINTPKDGGSSDEFTIVHSANGLTESINDGSQQIKSAHSKNVDPDADVAVGPSRAKRVSKQTASAAPQKSNSPKSSPSE